MREMPPLPAGAVHCPGFHGYAVSSSGEAWTCRTPGGSGRNRGGIGKEWRKLAPLKVSDGYLGLGLYSGSGRAKRARVHRLVLEAFVGPCPEGMECRHLDGDPSNNRLDNLAWGTQSQQHEDRALHGTSNRGHHRSGVAKLTIEEVAEIRSLVGTVPNKDLAIRYGVSRPTISNIRHRRKWSHC
jgi:hypothetical protein